MVLCLLFLWPFGHFVSRGQVRKDLPRESYLDPMTKIPPHARPLPPPLQTPLPLVFGGQGLNMHFVIRPSHCVFGH